MDGSGLAVLIGAIATLIGALVTLIRAGSSAYREAVTRAASELEHKRLADQAVATVKAKDDEITELKTENAWLKSLVSKDES